MVLPKANDEIKLFISFPNRPKISSFCLDPSFFIASKEFPVFDTPHPQQKKKNTKKPRAWPFQSFRMIPRIPLGEAKNLNEILFPGSTRATFLGIRPEDVHLQRLS